MLRVSSSLVMIKSTGYVLIDAFASLHVVSAKLTEEDPEKPNFHYPLHPPHEIEVPHYHVSII